MGTFRMRLLLIATSLALAAAAPHSEDRQMWRPAQGRDLSKFKPKLPEVAFGTPSAPRTVPKQFEFKKGNKSFAEECGLENPNGIEDRFVSLPPSLTKCAPSPNSCPNNWDDTKIVGGHEAAHHEWPWQVALFIDDAWFCGGSLISDEWVMTAAHCADGASYFDIMAGAHNVRESSEPNRVEVTSYNGWTHPLWNSNDLSGDLALIELPSPMPMNDYISTSCLPATGETPAVGSLVTVTGWGKPSDSAGGISPVLREVRDIPVMTNADCNAVYGIVGDGVVCIDTAGGRGSCNGDSGGPLVQKAGGKAAGDQWTQVGIVSFGASAGCEVGMPAGFTRTEYYLDWIKSETGMP